MPLPTHFRNHLAAKIIVIGASDPAHAVLSYPTSTQESTMLSIFRYPGGKSKVRGRILKLAPDRYAEYREPFVGGGGVFFGVPPVRRWINDMHTGVVAVYQALRDRPKEFTTECRKIPTARACTPGLGKGRNRAYVAAELERRFQQFVFDEEVDEALRYFVLQRCAMLGRVRYGDPQGTWFSAPEGWNVAKRDRLERAAEVMQGVTITQGDFLPLFEKPGRNVWVYADPPYISDTLRPKSSKLYQHSFTMEDHERLAEAVRHCEHQVLISYDDDEGGVVRSLYKGLEFIDENWSYSGATTSSKRVGKELLIGNYDLSSSAILSRIADTAKGKVA